MPVNCYININGIRFHYLDWGNKGLIPMLLLHGFMSHARVWDKFAEKFCSKFHILSLDQRGHGETEWSESGAYSIEDHFTDIAGFIEALGLKKLILAGHSMGGRNALMFAACQPYNIDRLILIDARPASSKESSKALEHLVVNLPLEAKSIDEIVKQVKSLYPYLSSDVCRHIVKYGYSQNSNGIFVPKYDIRMVQQSEKYSYQTQDMWLFMNQISCPVLIVRGSESPFLSRKDVKKMCGHIKQSRCVEIPGSTHMPVQENHEIFCTEVEKFIIENNN